MRKRSHFWKNNDWTFSWFFRINTMFDRLFQPICIISYWTFGGTIVRIIQNFWGTIVKIIASFEGRSPEKIAIILLLSRKNLNNSNYCPDKSSITDLFEFWGMIQTMHPPLRRIVEIISTKRREHSANNHEKWE